MTTDLFQYADLLTSVKVRIRQGQTRAVMAANAELISLYWDVGKMIDERQRLEGWGAGVIPRLSRDIRNELPEVKGFSERNIKLMVQFYHEYPDLMPIGQRAVAQLTVQLSPEQEDGKELMQRLVAQLLWSQNVLLIQAVKDLSIRCWYARSTIEQGWSRDGLAMMIKSRIHERQGKTVSNFSERLPFIQSKLVQEALKDPYIFDFMTLEEPFHERELETELIRHLEKFLLELGRGFAFVGRQYRLEVGEDDYYIDLLFYHLKLRCFVVIELKKGSFKAEYAGKMNFYCNVVDDLLRHQDDNPTIGLILCQDKKDVLAEYALRGIDKPIGVSEYELTRALPENLKSALPSIEDIERELSAGKSGEKKGRQRKQHE